MFTTEHSGSSVTPHIILPVGSKKEKSLTRPLRDLTAFLLNGKKCNALTVLAAGWDLLRWLTRVTAVSTWDLMCICLCFSRPFTVLRGL